jgi:transposase
MGNEKESQTCQKLRDQVRSLQNDNRELKAENRSLRQRIERLEKDLRESKRQATPFSKKDSSEKEKNKGGQSKGKPGRRKGKGTFSRREPPPAEETKRIEVPLEVCPDCGGPLVEKKTHQHYQTDIPLPKPIHRCFLTESGYCPECQRRFQSRHRQQTSTATGAAGVSIGPNAKAVAADCKHRLGISYGKIADMFHTLFGIEVSRGGLCQSNQRLAQKARPVYEQLVEAIRECCAVHSDETGWRIGTLSAWLWVFTSREITLYTIQESRGHEVVVEILGREFKGILHSDCFLAYDSKELADWIQQKCFAHFLRKLSEMEEGKMRGAVRFPRNVAAVLRQALQLREEKEDLSDEQFQERLGGIERRLDELIAETRNFTDPDNRRFAKRLRKQRRHLFTFLTHEGVEATNNRAERAIRPAVVARKMGGCNKTHSGARTHSVLASILTTARQQQVAVIKYLSSVACSADGPPPLLSFTPG